MNWNQIHALVTGGTRGIGAELVQQLHAKGAKVVATGSTLQTVEECKKTIPHVTWLPLDLAHPASRSELVSQAKGLGINMIIHNAGVQQMREWMDASAPVMFTTEQEMNINFTGPVELTRELLPYLTSQAASHIVFITSGLALAPKSSSPVYCASKAALRSFAKSLRGQLKQSGSPIQVIEALPPLVDTDMTRGRGKGKISPASAAQQILRGIEKGNLEIDVSATSLLRLVMRLSPALGERIMINR
jgi:uncharacterized oxidoreductase